MNAARAIGLLLGAAADGVIGRGELTPIERGLPTAGGLVVAGIVIERATRRSPVLQALGTAVATWAVLGGARLATDGTALARDLEEGRLDEARGALAELDTRETESLDVIGLSRATVESLARHTSDSVVGPMFWGAVAGIPGLVGARALTLLRVQGPLAELASFAPTRVAAALTVTGAPVVGGSASGAWRAWQRDTVAHPDPKTGRIEAAFAGALEVRLGGRTAYPSGVQERPVLGDGRNPDAGHVTRAVELSRVVGWLAAISSAVLALLTGLRRRQTR
ncbi:cobalamin biosynthesis protein [Amycolatopsis sp. GM8]|uniref:cobalamin biosynthesis protein CobD/CbiB n=1 Tax=Amycolatopsis sp. GM8 TaxID=2896530 RepID=UPI001F027D2A|nr:cobalamin biosynthesis protein [Amycolatopsis sp. GM8]